MCGKTASDVCTKKSMPAGQFHVPVSIDFSFVSFFILPAVLKRYVEFLPRHPFHSHIHPFGFSASSFHENHCRRSSEHHAPCNRRHNSGYALLHDNCCRPRFHRSPHPRLYAAVPPFDRSSAMDARVRQFPRHREYAERYPLKMDIQRAHSRAFRHCTYPSRNSPAAAHSVCLLADNPQTLLYPYTAP